MYFKTVQYQDELEIGHRSSVKPLAQGSTSESSTLPTRYLFQIKIVIRIPLHRRRERRIAEGRAKGGYKHEERCGGACITAGGIDDMELYAITRGEALAG